MRTRRKGRELSEPSLDEMLDDPVVQIVMARDGVKRREIVALMGRLQTQRADSIDHSLKDYVPGE
jgi:hypothetical protein